MTLAAVQAKQEISSGEFRMTKTFKILSLFLTYPGEELQAFLNEGAEELRKEAILDSRITDNLREFASHFTELDLIEWQAHYVNLFDTSGNTSLYIFEHLKGDSKERGQAMTDLIDFYEESGFKLKEGELPDYLPAFLEFLSARDIQKATELLSQPVNVINRIYTTMKENNNIYSHVFEAIVSLSPVKPDDVSFKYQPGNLMDAGIDELYEEPPVWPGQQFKPEP